MKTKVIISSIIAMLIILFTSVIFAATGTVELKSDVNQVKKGETFTVTLSATSEEGINGIDTKYTYDSNKLELISESVSNSTNWSSLGTSPDITVICNSTSSIKNADIYVLKFKVKDNVSVGTTLKVETNNIILDTDAQTDSEVTILPKKVEIKVIDTPSPTPSPTSTSTPTPTPSASPTSVQSPTPTPSLVPTSQQTPTPNPTSSPTPMPTEGERTEIKDPNPSEVIKTEIKSPNVGGEKTSETVVPNALPKTGKNYIVISVSIVIAIVSSIIFYKKYIQHRDIK